MSEYSRHHSHLLAWGIFLLTLTGAGCVGHKQLAPPDAPHELARVALPPYVIESPDVLQIDAVRLIPRPPYRIEPLDSIAIRVTDPIPEQPIQGVYGIDADGTVNLGFDYGSVFVRGLTIEEARNAIDKHLRPKILPGYQVTVAAAESRAMQAVRGPHLVQTDGTITLGLYGSVNVDNMTIPQAKYAIEAHLSRYLVDPEVSISVSGFNSKVYYIIFEGGGLGGDQIVRQPMTGKTTVLDALAQVQGLPFQACRHKIWVARPAPSDTACPTILPVDYKSIAMCGQTGTNYQLFPGDRIYVKADALLKSDAYLGRLIAPIERVMGTTLLTTSVISSIRGLSGSGGNNGNNANNGNAGIIIR